VTPAFLFFLPLFTNVVEARFYELRLLGVLGNWIAASKGIHRAAEKALGCM
jgi:hypothetical protein